jgi:quercetin dioxygenase-like cupin family protein
MKYFDPADYPEMIRHLPEIDVPIEGVRGWLMQGTHHQLVFFDIDPVGKIPEHSHGAQYGVVISGEMELTIAGETKTCKGGDSYYIPKGAMHSAVFRERTIVIDFFQDRDRYNAK